MALASLFQPLKPLNFKPTSLRGLAAGGYSLPDGGAPTPNATPPPPVGGAVHPTHLPYDEFGLANNSPAPLNVGDVPKPGSQNTAPSGNNSGGGGGYDWNTTDPILMQIRALNAQMVANAENAALANRKTEEIGFGYDQNLHYADPATAEAAKQNKFSTLEQLLFGHTNRAHDLDENLNKANLFYSGERAKQVGLEGRQYTLEQSNANQGLQQRLAAITQSVLNTKLQAQQQEIQGESDAYNRYLQYALANGLDGSGGGGGGSGGGGGGRGGLENAGQFSNGFTPDQLQAAAAQYSAGRSYNGSPYTPGQVMQEGHVEVRNGVPGVYIKYRTAGGDSTEWTPIK